MKQFLIFFSLLLICQLDAQVSDLGPFKTTLGEQVPSFSFETIGGRQMDIKDLEGKIVLINFWATWCGPCLRELPELNKFVKTLNSKDFVVLAIARDQSKETIQEYVLDKDYEFTFVPDVGKSIYLNFAEKGIPRNVLLNAEGKVLFQTLGYNLDDFRKMERMIEEEVNKLSN